MSRLLVSIVSVVCLVAAVIGPLSAQTWIPKSAARFASGDLVYDAARDRLVLFDGQTWEWDGAIWTLRSAEGPPVGRGALAYDPGTQTVLLFGGWNASSFVFSNATWVWNGFRWTRLFPPQSPPARVGHAMALDSVRERIVMFGGTSDPYFSTPRNDTWEWDGTTWTRTAVGGPIGRYAPSLAHDPVRQRTVLFGGDTQPGKGGAGPRDTWEWDGSLWRRVATSGPSDRWAAGATYDAARQRVVMYGGVKNGIFTQSALADQWEWDGDAWTQRLAAAAPGPMGSHGFAYDPLVGRIFLVGSTTWSWDGAQWTHLDAGPRPRLAAAAAYDARRREVVLFSGNAAADTWLWDGRTWRQALPASQPTARTGHAMAFDAARGEVVLFGGKSGFTLQNDTWVWDGSDWTEQLVAGPSARESAAMTFDAGRGRVLLFGGFGASAESDTWEWDGTAWTQRTPATIPPARGGAALACDPLRQRVVMFGGSTRSGFGWIDDTWEWDGADWIPFTPVTKPRPRADHGAAFSTALGRVVMTGGQGPVSGPDSWSWDGTDWTRIAGSGSLVGAVSIVEDTARNRLVGLEQIDGGFTLEGTFRTWEFGTRNAAGTALLGPGCGAPPPSFAAVGPATPGRSGFGLDLRQAAGGVPAVWLLAARAASAPIGSGCILHVDLASGVAVPTVTSDTGFAHLRLPLPLTLPLGLDLAAQAAVADGSGPFLGLSFTRGLRLTTGE